MRRLFILAAALFLPSAAWSQATPPSTMPSAPAVQAALLAPGLRVSDLDRSTRFYAVALGLVPGVTLHHGPVTEVILCADSKMGRRTLILLQDETPGKWRPVDPYSGLDKVVMRVPDLAGVVARMKAAGYPVGELHAAGAGPAVLIIRDPDGYGLELVQSGASHG